MHIAPIYSTNFNKPKNKNFQGKNKVIDDGDFVKIPKEKYQRDKIALNILGVCVLIELIYSICKSIASKPPKI